MESLGASGRASETEDLDAAIKDVKREIVALEGRLSEAPSLEHFQSLNELRKRLEDLLEEQASRERAEKEQERAKRQKLEEAMNTGLDTEFGTMSVDGPPIKPNDRLELALEAMRGALTDVEWPESASIKVPTTRVLSDGGSKTYKNVSVAPKEYRAKTDKGISLLVNDLKKAPFFKAPLDPTQACILFGPSGCGKTRRLLETLAATDGIFLTYRDEDEFPFDIHYGSTALATVMGEYERNVVRREAPLDENHAKFAVSCVLVGYLLIYEKMRSTYRNISSEKWLFLQLFPRHFFSSDVFLSVAQAGYRAAMPSRSGYWPDVESICETVKGQIGYEPRNKRNMLFALDEAQVWATMLPNKFLWRTSSSGPLLLPVRRCLGHFSKSFGHETSRVLLSGTGLSILNHLRYLTSDVGTTNPMVEYVRSDFPTISSEGCEELIKKYLRFATEKDAVVYAGRWLCGRPRHVSRLIEICHDQNQGKIDMAIVERVRDGLMGSDGRTILTQMEKLRTQYPVVLKDGRANPSEAFLVDALYVSFGLRNALSGGLELVEYGLAYPRNDGFGLGLRAHVENEPIVLEVARRFRAEAFWKTYVKFAVTKSDLGSRFEVMVAESLMSMLCDKPLGDALNTVRIDASAIDEETRALCLGAPRWEFGHYADHVKGPAEFFGWINRQLDTLRERPRPSRAKVLLPDDNAGPDLLSVHTAGAGKLVIVAVQVKYRANFDEKQAMLTVDPHRWYCQNRGKSNECVVDAAKDLLPRFVRRIDQEEISVVRIVLNGKKSAVSAVELANRSAEAQDTLIKLYADTLEVLLDGAEISAQDFREHSKKL